MPNLSKELNLEELWTDVDTYTNDLLIPPDASLSGALETSTKAGLRAINVAPNQGKLLLILARTCKAKKILEIGTLGGYSTIWLARALPEGGKLITLELDPTCAEIATSNIAKAGLSNRVELRLGKALESLPKLEAEGQGPFDLIFIDANKEDNCEYFEWALKLSHPGSLIIVDNVVRKGAIIDSQSEDPDVIGTRRLFKRMSTEKRVDATVLQTVGLKGYDGLAFAFVYE
jgi:predicted O-methyltransferase YrrM